MEVLIELKIIAVERAQRAFGLRHKSCFLIIELFLITFLKGALDEMENVFIHCVIHNRRCRR